MKKLFNFRNPELDRQIEEITQPVNYNTLANDTLAMDFNNNRIVQLTVTAARTLTTTIAPTGTICHMIVLTSGTSSFVITFGTGFKTTGTLTTGTANAKKFNITFVSTGAEMVEVCRTAAM